MSSDPIHPRRRRRAFDWSTATIAVFAFAAAAAVYWRDGAEHFLAILSGDLLLFGEMLPKVLAGCLIGAFVTLLLPRELVARWVGHESGFTGLVVAALFGFILPGGPITIYPVAGAFLAMGADAGAVVAFISSWTLIGYTRALVWELPFFGSDFVIWRIVEALPLPILAGLLARIAVRAGLARMGDRA
ncbi:MAG TPA: permease [Pseudolabrys sp.]|nr:permease [Pseudolabrys sp.]